MAVAIPQAFEAHALLFAGSYVAIQIGRHSFLTFAAADRGTVERERAGHILTWFAVVGVLWVAGALLDGPERIVLWLVALALDYCAPLVTYWIPGRAAPRARHLERGNGALRRALRPLHHPRARRVHRHNRRDHLRPRPRRGEGIIAFIMALFGLRGPLVAVLFVCGESWRALTSRSPRTGLSSPETPTPICTVVFVAGIILSAVGDELVIAHPTEIAASLRGRHGDCRASRVPLRPHPLRIQADGISVQDEAFWNAGLRHGRLCRPPRTRAGVSRTANRSTGGGDRI